MPHTTLQQATSPDITTLYNRTTWHTIHTLNSGHLPIITTINTRTKYKLQQNRHTITNYKKANWTPFTTDTEASFSDILPPPDIHTANTIFTNIPLGLAYLTNMYNISLNNNIIPHTWKLANIIPIPKPNKDMNIGTSYRPISLLSVIAKHWRRHYSHISQTTSHAYPRNMASKANHSTSTALHNINNTIATGFNQNKSPERIITVALNMSKTFDTVNIHTLTHKLHQTHIPHTIVKYIANYIKARKAYTTFRNKTSTEHQFKNSVPQGGVLSPTLFNIYTFDTTTPQAPVKLTTYADHNNINDINIVKANIQPYLHEIHTGTRTNNLILNPDNMHSLPTRPSRIQHTT